MVRPALRPADYDAVDDALGDDDAVRDRRYPGDDLSRQPVHTVYVPADRVHAGLASAWGAEALSALDQHGGEARTWADVLGRDGDEVADVWDRVRDKLATEPIEDLRIDLEDGYGSRADADEDADAAAAGAAVAAAHAAGSLPPFCGVRFKALEAATRRRGLRSLDIVLGARPRRRRAAVWLGADAAQGHVGSVRWRQWSSPAARLEEAYGLPSRTTAIRDPGRNTAGGRRSRWRGNGLCDDPGLRRPVHRPAFRHVRLHGRRRDRRRLSGDGPSSGRSRQAGPPGRGRRDRSASERRFDEHRAGWRRGVSPCGLEAARAARHTVTRARVLPGLGPPPCAAADPFPEHLPVFPSRSGPAGRSASRLCERRRRRRVLDEPATAAAMASFVVRGLRCGAIDTTEAGFRHRDAAAGGTTLAGRLTGGRAARGRRP